MIKFFKHFILLMGPIGFGLALSAGFFVMLIVAIGLMLSKQAISFIPALVVGSIGGAFGFSLLGTVIVVARSIFFALRSRLSRDG